MAKKRTQPFIYVTWLRNYLIGDSLCRWSIWHRIFHEYEAAKSDFDSVTYNMEHATLRHQVQQEYIKQGYEVIPEVKIAIRGDIAVMKGRIDLIALREDRNLIIEVKTGKPRAADKIQLMLYIWGLPKTLTRFRGGTYDGLIVYKNHEIEISAIEVDEIFVKNFTQFTKDILGPEPDRKYPSPEECKWCKIGNCDERMDAPTVEIETGGGYKPDFF